MTRRVVEKLCTKKLALIFWPLSQRVSDLVGSVIPWPRNCLFAQKPFEAPNRPNPPQTLSFPENPALRRNPPGILTQFIPSGPEETD